MQLSYLSSIQNSTPLSELSKEQLRELQKALTVLGYPVGMIDGLLGPKTRSAWAEFKTDIYQGDPSLIGPGSINAINEKIKKVGQVKIIHSSDQAETIEAIKQECLAQDITLNEQIAYILATVKWETAGTFQPVKEAYWHDEIWRSQNLRYYPYYGRGYVQLTWKTNYDKYSEILGIDLVGNPNLALETKTALFILVHGFKTGTFTGRKITDYINNQQADFFNARRCINGIDRAKEIESEANSFLREMQA